MNYRILSIRLTINTFIFREKNDVISFNFVKCWWTYYTDLFDFVTC